MHSYIYIIVNIYIYTPLLFSINHDLPLFTMPQPSDCPEKKMTQQPADFFFRGKARRFEGAEGPGGGDTVRDITYRMVPVISWLRKHC